MKSSFPLKSSLPGALLASGLLAAPAAQAASITIQNPSFEAPVRGPGGFGDATNWNASATGSVAGTYDPGPGYSNPVPDGNQIAFVNNAHLWQTLSALLQANTLYTLEVFVGRRTDDPFPGYSVELWAGDVFDSTAALLASSSAANPAPGTFEKLTLTWLSPSLHAMNGKPLHIVLRGQGPQTNFDVVTLDAVAQTPEPSAIALFASGAVLAAFQLRRKKIQA
jgi:hypothetical protein